jgi:hypothetical protein
MAESLKREYGRMAGMIMEAVPECDELIVRIREFELEINELG